MKELENKIIEFVQKRNWDQLNYPDSLIKSIVIEASELLECIQWDNNYDINQVSEELADVMIYCFQLAHSLNLDIEEIIEQKLIKNCQKYPIKDWDILLLQSILDKYCKAYYTIIVKWTLQNGVI